MTRLCIAAEDELDVRRVCGLVDRVLARDVEWIDAAGLDDHRAWTGLGEETWLDLHRARHLARARGFRPFGHFDGRRGAADALMHLAILFLFAEEDVCPEAVVVARDLDDQRDERREGWTEALTDRTWPFEAIGALAAPELEAWLVAAWSADDEGDKARQKSTRRRLGFDPTIHAERLTSKNPADKKDAKRVLEELCAEGRSGDARWESVAVDDIARSGRGCGLASFVAELRGRLVPLFTGERRPE